MITHLISSIEL